MSHLGHLEQPYIGDLLTMVINHLLTGIFEVATMGQLTPPTRSQHGANATAGFERPPCLLFMYLDVDSEVPFKDFHLPLGTKKLTRRVVEGGISSTYTLEVTSFTLFLL